MSSLWTPSGEHEPSGAPADQPGSGLGRRPGAGDLAGGPLSPEEAAESEALVRTRAELAAIPVPDIVANHAVGLWQLAILHLTPDPEPDGTPCEPRLADAGLAIDALGALVETLGARLAPHDESLREAVTQLRLAFVELSSSL